MKFNILPIVGIITSLLIVGCGGMSNSDSMQTPQVTGVINRIELNRVTIRGNNTSITYDTSKAVFESDGSGPMSVGQVVTVDGEHDGENGHADKIKYDSEVEGVVIANNVTFEMDTTSGFLNVMGQTVLVDDMTVFDNDSTDATIDMASQIPVDAVVEISGMLQDDGSILATRIELRSLLLTMDEEIEIKGIISNLGEHSFMLGACTIQLNEKTKYDDLEGLGELKEGMEVEVKSIGELVVIEGDSCSVTALKVELEDHEYHMDGMVKWSGHALGAPIEGMFSLKAWNEKTQEKVEISVKITDMTHFVHGLQADIIEGVALEVKGVANDDGAIEAHKITFAGMDMGKDPDIKIDAYVDGVSVDDKTISVLGLSIAVTDMTMINGYHPEPIIQEPAATLGMESPGDALPLSLADIVAGNYVKIMIKETDTGLEALHIMVKNVEPGEGSHIMGTVTSVEVVSETETHVYIEGVKAVVDSLKEKFTMEPMLVDLAMAIGHEASAFGTYSQDTAQLNVDHLAIHGMDEKVAM